MVAAIGCPWKFPPERQTWSFVSEYLIAGNRLGMEDFNRPYVHDLESRTKEEKKPASTEVEVGSG